jgi:hypothetical protein
MTDCTEWHPAEAPDGLADEGQKSMPRETQL